MIGHESERLHPTVTAAAAKQQQQTKVSSTTTRKKRMLRAAILFGVASSLRFALLAMIALPLERVQGNRNTILYPVSEDDRQQQQLRRDQESSSIHTGGMSSSQSDSDRSDNDKHKKESAVSSPRKRKAGAPSRYLEYEDPDATYDIRLGIHPSISYPDLENFFDTEIRVRYEYRAHKKRGRLLANDCPRHFLWLSDKAVKDELDYRLEFGVWSERVLVEKIYFTLFYGGTGLASRYMDSVDDFQTDLVGWEIMNRSSNHCDWEGIECENPSLLDGEDPGTGPANNTRPSVVGFQINGFSLEGTLPHDLYRLSKLRTLDLHGNRIRGTIPSSLGFLSSLVTIDLRDNRLEGTLPTSLSKWIGVERVLLGTNRLGGTVPAPMVASWARHPAADETVGSGGLETLDLSHNGFEGEFPFRALLATATDLEALDLSHNRFVGVLPNDVGGGRAQLLRDRGTNKALVAASEACASGDDESSSGEPEGDRKNRCLHRTLAAKDGGEVTTDGMGKKLGDLNLSFNTFSGSLPEQWMEAFPGLTSWNLSHNKMTGMVPNEIWKLTFLERLDLGHNRLTGEIPSEETISRRGDSARGHDPRPMSGGSWSDLVFLKLLDLEHNELKGTIPHEFLAGLSSSLEQLALGKNLLRGNIPSTIEKMTKLQSLDLHGNDLTGNLPTEMRRMQPDLKLNLTDNSLIGTVPKIFCGRGAMSSSLLFRQSGCDAILCPPGTFHPNGAASLYSGCRPCPTREGDDPSSAKTLGRLRCGENSSKTTFVHGDLNGDGVLTEREILRLLYTYTVGKNWGLQYESWADPAVDKCDLNGIVCAGGKVTRIDLTDASLCATVDRKAVPAHECKGIPAEISKLTRLAVLTMNRRQFLRGTMPTEIGALTKLQYLDMSNCPLMTGRLPSEIGHLTQLKYLNIGGCRFNGTIPEELFELSGLEKLHLSMNAFTGTISTSLRKMTNLKEFLLSRTYVNGTIPEGIGQLSLLENFEMYGNQLLGTIPESLGKCKNLKRIDLFNNKLTGKIPESLTTIKALQILHIKLNHLTGTISSGFGRLPALSWFDVSTNHLHGTIPGSFGNSETLKDFRLGGGNMIHDPIPKSLCSNANINGGLTKTYGCSGVICPLGTYSDPGHATHSDGCKRCPDGRTTIYLGSSRCVELTDDDILTMFYDVMAASSAFPVQQNHWAHGREGDVCSWNGVDCGENKTIESIWFPLLGLGAD